MRKECKNTCMGDDLTDCKPLEHQEVVSGIFGPFMGVSGDPARDRGSKAYIPHSAEYGKALNEATQEAIDLLNTLIQPRDRQSNNETTSQSNR